MLEAIRTTLAPWYLYLKFMHLLMVMIWGWSTMVGYVWYVCSSYLKSKRNPEDVELKRRADWALEQFDRGVVLEHIAFLLTLVTGLLLFVTGGWTIESSWLSFKFLIIGVIFIPMETLDIWLSHFGGNKYRIRMQGDPEKYERMVRFHWKFFEIVTPLVFIFIPVLIFLAVVKP